MYISNVEIKGYKSINYDGVSFSLGQIAAFIGKNSAGKSNLLEALDHFFNNTPMFPDDFYRKETDKPIEITVSFCLDDDDTSFDLVLHANKRMITLRRTFDCGQKPQTFMVGGWKYTADDSFNPLITPSAAVLKKTLTSENVQAFLISNFPCRTVDTPTQYVELLKEYWQDHFESMPKEWDPTLTQPLKALPAALPAYYYLPVTYTVGDETKLGKNSRFQSIYNHILGSIDELLSEAHTHEIRKQIDRLYKKSGVEKRRLEINKLLSTIDNTHSGASMHIEFAPVDISALSQRATHIMIDDGFDSTVNSKGHGIQRDAIVRLLRVYTQLKASENKTHFILAIDEPELYMHPTYKRSLYNTFVEMSGSGCQILYTTHDPAFVSVAQFDNIHIVRKEQDKHQHTSVKSCSLSTIKKTEVFWKSYRGKSDTAIRSELQHKCHGEQNEGFFADKVIIVEGATEKYALPIYFRKLGYDLDAANIAVVTAESVTLIAQLFTIFSSLSIPCYCIFDGDKPRADDYATYLQYLNGNLKSCSNKQKEICKKCSNTLTRNKELIKCISGQVIDGFQPTLYEENFTMWEYNFEENIHKKIKGYSKTRDEISRSEGISSESKPLVAAAVAESYSNRRHLPQCLESTIKELIDKIKQAQCVDLRFPEQLPIITLHSDSEQKSGLIPVFSCAAGRNTIVDSDTAIGYAQGDFPEGTDFLIHIQGTSMEPYIPDNSYVAAKYYKEALNGGEYVICSLDGGEMVCKQFIQYPKDEKVISKLVSLNKSCGEIIITEGMQVTIQGKVLGKRNTFFCFQTEE